MKKTSTYFKILLMTFVLFSGYRLSAQMSIAANATILCVSQPTNYVTASVTASTTGVASYSWSILPSNCGLFLNASAGTATFNISCGGNYTISCTAYNSSNVAITTATTLVQAADNPAPQVNITPNNGVGCLNTTFTVSYSNNFSYTTNIPGFTVSSQSFPWTVTATACYSVIGTNSLNCTNSSPVCFSVIPSPTVTVVSTSTALCLGQSATVIANGANTYSWNNSSTSNVNVVTPSTSTIVIVTGTAVNGCTATAGQVIVVNVNPTINIAATSTVVCAGQPVTLTATGGNSYTWNTGQSGNPIVVSPSVSTCYSVAGTNLGGCTQVSGLCVNVNQGPALNILGNSNTVCIGSSATYTATGGITYTWSNSSTTNPVNILTSASGTIGVSSTGANGCIGNAVTYLFIDTTCADVWPGDANSDGNVTSADVFEIGLAFNSTGTARSPGGNTYVAQHATNWTGTISTAKNLCHADCNGDGSINNNDTVAIFNNFNMTHSFKPGASSSNPDITLVGSPVAFIGIWNVADVVVGSSTANISQLYGVSFDLNFDVNLIDDAYLVYNSSFLNASNQNVEFRKRFINNGKIVGATVRTDKNDVAGNGKIAELHYKVKAGLAPNTQLDFSVSNSQKVGKNGMLATLNPGTLSQQTIHNTVGINKQSRAADVLVYPNPASLELMITTTPGETDHYTISDLSGRIVAKASFTGNVKVDVSNLTNGVYFVNVESANGNSTQKVVVDHH